MKRVMVYFDCFGRKLKTEMTVYNDAEIQEKLADKINVLKVDVLEVIPESQPNNENGQQIYDFLFGKK